MKTSKRIKMSSFAHFKCIKSKFNETCSPKNEMKSKFHPHPTPQQHTTSNFRQKIYPGKVWDCCVLGAWFSEISFLPIL